MKSTRKKGKTKAIILTMAIVVALVIAVVVSILVIGNSPSRRLSEQLRGTSAEAQEPVVSWTDQSGERSAFLDRIRQEEGVASKNEFLTMQGTEWLPFPEDVYGYVSSAFVDLDGDGTQEVVILRTASDGIFVDIHRGKEGGYEKSFSSKISEFDPSSAQMIYLFRNPSGGGYFIFADRLSTSSYTRVTAISADLYALTADAVTPSLHCEWVSVVNTADEFSHIAETLKGARVPYAVYAADYDNRSAGDDFTILCNIQLRSEDAPSFDDLKLFLKITADASVTPALM